MFTGIIEDVGKVKGIVRRGGGAVIQVESGLNLLGEKPGDSISVNGACLTMINITGHLFEAEVSPETLARTNLGMLKVGDSVNLERALTPSSRMGGHIVNGHVEDTVTLKARRRRGEYVELTFTCSPEVARYIVPKGSVALDGISLTINECRGRTFSVMIIPHTLKATNLGSRKEGDKLNVETDILGKYVEKLLSTPKEGGGKLGMEFLAEKGFL